MIKGGAGIKLEGGAGIKYRQHARTRRSRITGMGTGSRGGKVRATYVRVCVWATYELASVLCAPSPRGVLVGAEVACGTQGEAGRIHKNATASALDALMR